MYVRLVCQGGFVRCRLSLLLPFIVDNVGVCLRLFAHALKIPVIHSLHRGNLVVHMRVTHPPPLPS